MGDLYAGEQITVADLLRVIDGVPAAGKSLRCTSTGRLEYSFVQRDDHVLVKSESDLPAVSGGAHTLAAKIYEIAGTVVLTSPIQMSAGSVLMGMTPARDILAYVGSGAAVRFGTASGEVRRITIAGTGSNNGVSIAGASNEVSFNGCVITGVATAIDVNGCDKTYVIDCSMRSFAVGVSIAGTNDAVLCTRCQYLNGTASWVGIRHVSGTTQIIAIYDGVYGGGEEAGTALKVEDVAVIGRRGIYTGNVLDGAVTAVVGLDESDALWLYQTSGGIYDSRSMGYLYWNDNASPTDIVTQNVWVKAAGTNTGSTYERMTVGSNRLTYKDTRSALVRIDVNVALFTGSNNQTITIGVAKNGTPVGAATTLRADAANQRYPGSVRVVASLMADDYVEVWVRNQTGTADVTVEDLQMDAFR